MLISYNKLWKLAIDRELKKNELCSEEGISSSSITKIDKSDILNTVISVKICSYLQCDISKIME